MSSVTNHEAGRSVKSARFEAILDKLVAVTTNGAPYDPHQAIRSDAETSAAPVDRPDAQIAEQIKRRQISLSVRYVAALRAR
jgi:hypothetical protein